MLFARATRFERERRNGVADQETGPFVEADDRKTSVERQRIQPQEALHLQLAVYSHIILPPKSTRDDLVTRTRKTYKGPLEVGEDLMIITVGESVTVQPLSVK